jgi:hypothetical protein
MKASFIRKSISFAPHRRRHPKLRPQKPCEAGSLPGASLPGEWIAKLAEHAEVVYQYKI